MAPRQPTTKGESRAAEEAIRIVGGGEPCAKAAGEGNVALGGYLPLEKQIAHLFFQLVSRRYERGSLLLTTNQTVTQGGQSSATT